CNDNGVHDGADISGGTSTDFDADGIPDDCQCLADIDGNGEVDVIDFLALLAAWGPNPGDPADINRSGAVDVLDFLLLLAAWGPCP
ncbi:MAG: dockerin type I domain-containing protein, partial [Planctomycetota bacterium]